MRRLCVTLAVMLAALARVGSASTVDSTDSSVSYEPPSEWVEVTSSEAYGGSVYGCSTSGASAGFTFVGTSFQFYGRTDSTSGTGTITFDGTQSTYDFYSSSDVYDTLIFSKSGLTNGQHTFLLTNSDEGKNVWIDRFVYSTSSSSSGSSGGSSSSSSSSSPTSSSSSSPSSSSSSSSSNSSSTNSNSTLSTLITSSYTTVVDGKTVATQGTITTTVNGTDSAQETNGLDGNGKNSSASSNASDSGGGSSQSSHVGVIVGGVVGGVAVAAAIVSLLIWYFKRRNQTQNAKPIISIIDEKGQEYADKSAWDKRLSINPFISPAHTYQNLDSESPASGGSQHYVTKSDSSQTFSSPSFI